jgi:hypothetical protein
MAGFVSLYLPYTVLYLLNSSGRSTNLLMMQVSLLSSANFVLCDGKQLRVYVGICVQEEAPPQASIDEKYGRKPRSIKNSSSATGR